MTGTIMSYGWPTGACWATASVGRNCGTTSAAGGALLALKAPAVLPLVSKQSSSANELEPLEPCSAGTRGAGSSQPSGPAPGSRSWEPKNALRAEGQSTRYHGEVASLLPGGQQSCGRGRWAAGRG